jgi:leader peptidase (prepilin peptidase) / N-methyltransferase
VSWLPKGSLLSLVVAWGGAVIACALLFDHYNALFGALLATAVLMVAIVDIDRFEIPDLANIAILLTGLTWHAWANGIEDVCTALVRSVAAAALLLLVRKLYRYWRDIEGLGLGDVKLAAAGAVWLDWSQMWFALLIAVIGAALLIAGRRLLLKEPVAHDTALPFGAFLAPAIWIAWIVQMSAN